MLHCLSMCKAFHFILCTFFSIDKRERNVNAVGTEGPTDNNANAGQQFGRAGHRAAGANRYIS